jgi:tRNA 2-selenouridine synthase
VKQQNTVDVTALDDFDEIVDVRSPAEFALDHIPRAVNCPVLDDEERAHVGTLYKQVSPFEARKVGAALVAKNLARHIDLHFSSRDERWKPLIYCWRGGKRSRSMAHVLREIGWNAATLDGGYQTFRRAVLAQLEELPSRLEYRVVCGPTGSGKSRLLQALTTHGAQVLDLEILAQHRGSVLGDMPGTAQPSQKMFESRLWHALRGLHPGTPVFVEAESRKIGNLRIPETLLENMRHSECIRIDVPLAERVRFLVAEYGHFLREPGWLKAKLLRLAALHSTTTVARWNALIDACKWEALVRDLLQIHYDPAYARSMQNNYVNLAHATALDVGAMQDNQLATAAMTLCRAHHTSTV